jgi:hypothetical protein
MMVPLCFLAEILCTIFVSTMRGTWPAHLIFLDYITQYHSLENKFVKLLIMQLLSSSC